MPTWLIVIAAAIVLVGAAVTAMAIGVIMGRPCLRGSCGGAGARGAKGESLSCSTCPNRTRKGAVS